MVIRIPGTRRAGRLVAAAWVLALIAADVVLAVALAIKRKMFSIVFLANFYRTMVIPMLLGWLAAAILARFVVAELLPPSLQMLGPGIDALAYTAIVLSIGGSIVGNFKSLWAEVKGWKSDEVPF
jgi:hypothetical protein